jgi:hypothetical protein
MLPATACVAPDLCGSSNSAAGENMWKVKQEGREDGELFFASLSGGGACSTGERHGLQQVLMAVVQALRCR